MKTAVHIAPSKEKSQIKSKISRRINRKISLDLEYKKLRSLLPRQSKRTSLQGKVNVVDAAYQYIRQLQTALLDKFSSRGLPPDLAGVVGNKVTSDKDVQALALHLIKQNNCSTSSVAQSNDNNNNLDENQNFDVDANCNFEKNSADETKNSPIEDLDKEIPDSKPSLSEESLESVLPSS